VTIHRLKVTNFTLFLLTSTAVASSVWAQSAADDAGGVQLRFGLGLGIEAQSNRSLSVDNPGTSTEAFADLSMGLESETRTQSLSFDLSGRLRKLSAPDILALDEGFSNPTATLGYRLSGATSQLRLSAQISETDLSDSNLFIDDDGSFGIIAGDATRRASSVEARLDWNEDARVSYGVFARYNEDRFIEGTATGLDGNPLDDTQRLTLGGNATLDLSKAASLDVGLSYSRFAQGALTDDRETWALDNTLTLNRPAGDVLFSVGVTDSEDGTRISTSVGRTYTLPQATLFGQIGATRQTLGDTGLTGALEVEYPLPRGALTLGLSRDVSSSNLQDEERLNTQVNLGYQQALTKLSNVNVGLIWAEATDTESDRSFIDGTMSVAYSRTLTEDWNMDLGVRHRYSDDDGIGSARSNEVFFTMRRSYLTKF